MKANASKPKTIDEYISDFPTDVQQILQKLRRIIAKTAPEAKEAISYGIPSFTLDGKYLVYFAGYKHHVSLYPIPAGTAGLHKKMEAYRAGKGTLQFPLDKPIPYGLMTLIVKSLKQAHAQKAAARRAKPK